ncbi:MAG: Carbohydrate ABC transporter ATP-binding protein, CUT1 family [Thermotoga sp. 50_1627]|nr:MAG: Carbohydrate ABC transporter ATP-binding protein, CUT1 family [Thermotoga sp. 50_64]KUK25991.1 MAG: Carbohydrate ABC transporter ATP-binding protein, CUT1 family [Thermotoga sp. 50_1627]MDK2922680.1 multiple sugar transport system ATP-binding protein [Pseudothermotoga sp.]HBT38654.1 glycerol-3-phosphate ABC transporter ATP-binding protein [Pseudothermotoga sp.]HCO98167.1 glycerol-3-phosphate ABC transporter ATP-binding protein [Pseudothermotoga sp.]
MAKVELENVTKIFDNKVVAVKDVTLTVEDKEFVVLLGPSGCGKTTTLRMIAGLEEVTKGTIKIDGKVVNDVEPKDRDIAMVFQNYALYPHMTVYENMAFGLKLRKFPKDEIDRRVKEAARILGIEELLDRKPRQLSGGQRQRVAVGRAIVRNPKVFLFDEPLSNLDAKLRVQMRSELKKLHHRLGATIIYVTHDQVEAMTMADKIVIMKDGTVQQIGTPYEVYNKPANTFVAGFIGSPAMNFLNAVVVAESGGIWIKTSGFKVKVIKEHEPILEPWIDKEVIFGIRPENIFDKLFAIAPQPENTITGTVDVVEPLGSETLLHVTCGEDSLVARVDPRTRAKEGEKIDLVFDMNTIHVFDRETQKAIL